MDDLHALIEDVWIARHDDELQAERAQRRKGRPPSIREGQLELIKNTELEEYRTGIGAPPATSAPPSHHLHAAEVPDLTHRANVTLFRRWDGKDPAFLDLLRYIRISSATPDKIMVSRPGRHSTLIEKKDEGPMDTS